MELSYEIREDLKKLLKKHDIEDNKTRRVGGGLYHKPEVFSLLGWIRDLAHSVKCDMCGDLLVQDYEETEGGVCFCSESVSDCLERAKEEEDRCDECGGVLDDEDWIEDHTMVPYGDGMVPMDTTCQFTCHLCGYTRE